MGRASLKECDEGIALGATYLLVEAEGIQKRSRVQSPKVFWKDSSVTLSK